jgi:hypothetical protein
MAFDKSLWDGSDPLYAPCISWSRKYPSWKCPKKYLDAGFETKTVRLEPSGSPEDEHQAKRALRCRQLTQELVQWWDAMDAPKIKPGTWEWLIARYRTDEFSPFQDVKANTRANYEWLLDKWLVAIGHMNIEDLTFEEIKRTELAMKNNGRSKSYIKRLFKMLRIVAGYGRAIQCAEATMVSAVLSQIRFRSSPARKVYPTREQVYAVVAEADKGGNRNFSLGIILQYELILRAVDVRGQWLKSDEKEGGIVRNGKRWQDGLTWDMVNDDLSGFEKVISKTARSMPEPRYFDLSNLPEIQARLAETPEDKRVGPVILTDRLGMPFTTVGWSQAWARYRKAAGIPENIWVMDARAGGVTEAKEMGADPFSLRDAAQHANVTTTNRYARGNASGKVVALRQKGTSGEQ